jgi:hypothetical protein
MIQENQLTNSQAARNAFMAAEILGGTTFDPKLLVRSESLWSSGKQDVVTADDTATLGSGSDHFRGRVEVAGLTSVWPEVNFIVLTAEENRFVIESERAYPWPQIKIDLELDASRKPKFVRAVHLDPADRTVDAEILYTRLIFALMGDGFFRLRDLDNDLELKLKIHAREADESWFYLRSKQSRKLKFIEETFGVQFRLPEDATWGDARRIEMAFRCLTEAKFNTRHQVFGVAGYAPTVEELGRPPFAGPGEFDCTLAVELAVYDQSLDLTPAAVHLGAAEVLDLDKLKEAVGAGRQPAAVSFVVLNQQVSYRFPDYEPRVEELRGRLEEFRRRLLAEESAELAGLLDAPLAKPVTEDEARQIVIGWLQYHDFPDRFWPNVARLEGAKWRVPVWIAYPSGKGAPVEDAFVDAGTGEMSLPFSAEEMRARGKSVADALSRAG